MMLAIAVHISTPTVLAGMCGMATISIEYGSAIETTASASPERQHVHGEELRPLRRRCRWAP